MNWGNVLKTAVDVYSTVQQVSTQFQQVWQANSKFEKASLKLLNALEDSDNLSTNCRIFKSNRPPRVNEPLLFYVVFLPSEVIVSKTADLSLAKRQRNRLNELQTLARLSAEINKLDDFLALVLEHLDWQEVHLAARLGLGSHIFDICRRGDALSIVSTSTAREGFFPLHLAAEKGHNGIVQLLLDNGAELNKCDLSLKNALHFAVRNLNEETCVRVLTTMQTKKRDQFEFAYGQLCEDGLTPLHLACQCDNYQAVQFLLRNRFCSPLTHGDRLFCVNPLSARCLDHILLVDPTVYNCQREPNLLLHRPFSRDMVKIVAARVPDGLEFARSSDGMTPLHAAARRGDLDATVALLSYGSNFTAVDKQGNTVLHHAVAGGSISIVKLLLCFGADPNTVNLAGAIPLSGCPRPRPELTKLLKDFTTWSAQQATLSRSGLSDFLSSTPRSIIDVMQQKALKHHLDRNEVNRRKTSVRLLSLDGGGIRGLVLIQILMELESRLKQRSGGEDDGSILTYFDWIAGTSTGAILALALADETPLVECLRLYLRFKDDVFADPAQPTDTVQPTTAAAGDTSAGLSSLMPTFRRYTAESIEKFLQLKFGERRTMKELKKRVMVTATRADLDPPELVLFRSYAAPAVDKSFFPSDKFIDPGSVTIWKAARCSSAAPTYFPSVDGSLMDGGLIANNPAMDLLVDVQTYNAAAMLRNEPVTEVACLVSVGTGRKPSAKLTDIDLAIPGFNLQSITKSITALQNLKTILVEQVACSDGQVVGRTQSFAHSLQVPFFRLTPNLLSEIPLDTIDNETLVNMMWTTKVYINTEAREEVNTLVQFLYSF